MRKCADPLSYDEVLKYARKLSQTTTAPPGFKLQLDDDDVAEDEGAAAAELSARTKKALYQGGDEGEQGKVGRVPAHLQEKLPFPSENALRRSIMSQPLLSWQDYQRGLQTGEDEEQQQPGGQIEGQGRPAMYIQSRGRPTTEEDDDGFGLDLN